MKKKKPYSKPVITVIKLDPAQALISACIVGGAYFNVNRGGTRVCMATGRGGYCITRVRGRSHFTAGRTFVTSTQPS